MKIYKIGIIGCGGIAQKMAATLEKMKGVERYAVASRNQEKAEAFANKWGFTKAYGSYEELASDPEVDLIYIATPHAMHYDNAHMCIEKGKPVLCEKAFTANARQAEDLLGISLYACCWALLKEFKGDTLTCSADKRPISNE
jgi:predicted dehydrogenase